MSKPKTLEVRNLLLFFLIAFAWSWLLWLPSVIISVTDNQSLMYWIQPDVDLSAWLLLLILGGILSTLGPSVAAFVVAAYSEGKAGTRDLWKRFWSIRLPGKWLIVSFVFWPILLAIPFIIAVITEGQTPDLFWVSQPLAILGLFFNNFTRSGGMSEEFGWRGYALPRLQAKWNALTSSLILGVIWAVWHAPLWFIAGDSHQGSSFLMFSANLVLVSVLYTWIYNNANESILAAVVFHAMANTAAQMLPALGTDVYRFGVLVLAVILVVVIYGPMRLAREPAPEAVSGV
jgi:membrane protease YdiL (CAAX protease family)